MTHAPNTTQAPDDEARTSSSGTSFGYSVEARYNYPTPKRIGNAIYDNRWREIETFKNTGRYGVPEPAYPHPACQLTGLFSLAEAEALRWGFICLANSSSEIGRSWCLETRIVEFKIEYSYSAKRSRYLNAFDLRGDLPDDMKPTETEDKE